MKILFKILRKLHGISTVKYSDSEKIDAWGLDMTLDQIADLFKVMEWKYDLGDRLDSPNAKELAGMISYLMGTLEDHKDTVSFSNMGRLLVYTDPDFPSFYSVAVEIGMLPKTETEGE